MFKLNTFFINSFHQYAIFNLYVYKLLSCVIGYFDIYKMDAVLSHFLPVSDECISDQQLVHKYCKHCKVSGLVSARLALCYSLLALYAITHRKHIAQACLRIVDARVISVRQCSVYHLYVCVCANIC